MSSILVLPPLSTCQPACSLTLPPPLPENAIDCSSYINDPSDRELYHIADYLEHIHNIDDVRGKTR
jgi:hypothetical protein